MKEEINTAVIEEALDFIFKMHGSKQKIFPYRLTKEQQRVIKNKLGNRRKFFRFDLNPTANGGGMMVTQIENTRVRRARGGNKRGFIRN